jgi:hypothetical protein
MPFKLARHAPKFLTSSALIRLQLFIFSKKNGDHMIIKGDRIQKLYKTSKLEVNDSLIKNNI